MNNDNRPGAGTWRNPSEQGTRSDGPGRRGPPNSGAGPYRQQPGRGYGGHAQQGGPRHPHGNNMWAEGGAQHNNRGPHPSAPPHEGGHPGPGSGPSGPQYRQYGHTQAPPRDAGARRFGSAEETAAVPAPGWGKDAAARQLVNAAPVPVPASASAPAHMGGTGGITSRRSGDASASVAHKHLPVPVLPPKFGMPAQRSGSGSEARPSTGMQILGKPGGQRGSVSVQGKPSGPAGSMPESQPTVEPTLAAANGTPAGSHPGTLQKPSLDASSSGGSAHNSVAGAAAAAALVPAQPSSSNLQAHLDLAEKQQSLAVTAATIALSGAPLPLLGVSRHSSGQVGSASRMSSGEPAPLGSFHAGSSKSEADIPPPVAPAATATAPAATASDPLPAPLGHPQCPPGFTAMQPTAAHLADANGAGPATQPAGAQQPAGRSASGNADMEGTEVGATGFSKEGPSTAAAGTSGGSSGGGAGSAARKPVGAWGSGRNIAAVITQPPAGPKPKQSAFGPAAMSQPRTAPATAAVVSTPAPASLAPPLAAVPQAVAPPSVAVAQPVQPATVQPNQPGAVPAAPAMAVPHSVHPVQARQGGAAAAAGQGWGRGVTHTAHPAAGNGTGRPANSPVPAAATPTIPTNTTSSETIASSSAPSGPVTDSPLPNSTQQVAAGTPPLAPASDAVPTEITAAVLQPTPIIVPQAPASTGGGLAQAAGGAGGPLPQAPLSAGGATPPGPGSGGGSRPAPTSWAARAAADRSTVKAIPQGSPNNPAIMPRASHDGTVRPPYPALGMQGARQQAQVSTPTKKHQHTPNSFASQTPQGSGELSASSSLHLPAGEMFGVPTDHTASRQAHSRPGPASISVARSHPVSAGPTTPSRNTSAPSTPLGYAPIATVIANNAPAGSLTGPATPTASEALALGVSSSGGSGTAPGGWAAIAAKPVTRPVSAQAQAARNRVPSHSEGQVVASGPKAGGVQSQPGALAALHGQSPLLPVACPPAPHAHSTTLAQPSAAPAAPAAAEQVPVAAAAVLEPATTVTPALIPAEPALTTTSSAGSALPSIPSLEKPVTPPLIAAPAAPGPAPSVSSTAPTAATGVSDATPAAAAPLVTAAPTGTVDLDSATAITAPAESSVKAAAAGEDAATVAAVPAAPAAPLSWALRAASAASKPTAGPASGRVPHGPAHSNAAAGNTQQRRPHQASGQQHVGPGPNVVPPGGPGPRPTHPVRTGAQAMAAAAAQGFQHAPAPGARSASQGVQPAPGPSGQPASQPLPAHAATSPSPQQPASVPPPTNATDSKPAAQTVGEPAAPLASTQVSAAKAEALTSAQVPESSTIRPTSVQAEPVALSQEASSNQVLPPATEEPQPMASATLQISTSGRMQSEQRPQGVEQAAATQPAIPVQPAVHWPAQGGLASPRASASGQQGRFASHINHPMQQQHQHQQQHQQGRQAGRDRPGHHMGPGSTQPYQHQQHQQHQQHHQPQPPQQHQQHQPQQQYQQQQHQQQPTADAPADQADDGFTVVHKRTGRQARDPPGWQQQQQYPQQQQRRGGGHMAGGHMGDGTGYGHSQRQYSGPSHGGPGSSGGSGGGGSGMHPQFVGPPGPGHQRPGPIRTESGPQQQQQQQQESHQQYQHQQRHQQQPQLATASAASQGSAAVPQTVLLPAVEGSAPVVVPAASSAAQPQRPLSPAPTESPFAHQVASAAVAEHASAVELPQQEHEQEPTDAVEPPATSVAEPEAEPQPASFTPVGVDLQQQQQQQQPAMVVQQEPTTADSKSEEPEVEAAPQSKAVPIPVAQVATADEEFKGDDGDDSFVSTGSNLFAALAEEEDEEALGSAAAAAAPAATHRHAPSITPVNAAEAAAAELQSLLFSLSDVSTGAAGPAALPAAAIPSFPPRGLVNTGNSCFVNASLQALLGCPPFCALLSRLERARLAVDPATAPTLHGLALLASQLVAGVPHPSTGNGAGVPGQPLADTNTAQGGAVGSSNNASAPGPDTEERKGEAGDAGAGWSEVPKPRGRKAGRTAAVPLSVFNAGGPNAVTQPAAGARQGTAASARNGSHQQQQQQQQSEQQSTQRGLSSSAAAAAAALWRQPLTPSSLNEVVRKFSPEYAAHVAAQATGMLATIPKPSGKSGGVQHHKQEQHDAQEFLHFLLDHAHEELLALAKAHESSQPSSAPEAAQGEGDGEEWAQVGRRNKAAVTRQAGAGASGGGGGTRTAINALFSGATKSVIKCGASKPSATVEPFMMLHLDIEQPTVTDLESALAHHLASVTLTDYKPEGSASVVHAVKHLYLYRLPQVLVLHLKRFAYTGSIVKNHKHVSFDTTLRLRKPIIGEDCPDVGRGGTAEFGLVATVSHHGKHAAGGHYTADVLQSDGAWLRFNDTAVDLVSPAAVVREQPYILMYQLHH